MNLFTFIFVIAFSSSAVQSFHHRKVIDFVPQPKDEQDHLARDRRDDDWGADDEDSSCRRLLAPDEQPPDLKEVFAIYGHNEDLDYTEIETTLPDGTTLSRVSHRVGNKEVWGSGATVAIAPPIRGLCAGPRRAHSASLPVEVGPIPIAQLMADNASPTWVSADICKNHWGISPGDEIYDNSTKVYFYPKPEGGQTEAHQVEIRGFDYRRRSPFRVFCLIDARKNETLKSWDGLQTYFGDGGNRKTSKYRYGENAKPQLPAVEGNSPDSCLMKNTDETVAVFDMKSRSRRIIPGRSSVANYKCSSGPDDAINGAYGPLADCFFNANKTTQFLLDPEWGFSTEMKKYVPNGVLNVGAHYSQRYDNAFWDGSSFYAGDGARTFLPLCTCLDVVAHEIGHAVTQVTSDLIYSEEPGCLNEAFSDMMGEAVEYYFQGSNDFKIGAKCMKTRPFLRDMSIKQMYNSFEEGDDPHHCSAVFNYAFYKLSNSPGWNIKSAWRSFLYANAFFWRKTSTMEKAACDVAAAAVRAQVPGDKKYIREAFSAVGIDVSACMPLTGQGTPDDTDSDRTASPSVAITPQQTTTTSTTARTTTKTTTTTTAKTTTAMPWYGQFTMPAWLTVLFPRENTPLLTFPPPAATTVFTTTVGHTTTTTPGIVIETLSNCEEINELYAATGTQLYFKIYSQGSAKMHIFMDGYSGDADIYVMEGSVPTTTNYHHRPYWRGSTEWVRTKVNYNGWVFIMVNAAQEFYDLSLSACFIPLN